ncbi:glycerol-3-phosphate acyltransferase 2, mitochondrial [Chanos chanos]|uniref:Glycerol-3-phosphate acyltransferase 2, mitochondrial n=1 Tax=Chanos chanos TaxID=29144 RepID=A0A6J2UPU7_CHACN|nr:glycerol-3-phosphate acyltransferase 2, mitochondrial-like [Chanos chanos]
MAFYRTGRYWDRTSGKVRMAFYRMGRYWDRTSGKLMRTLTLATAYSRIPGTTGPPATNCPATTAQAVAINGFLQCHDGAPGVEETRRPSDLSVCDANMPLRSQRWEVLLSWRFISECVVAYKATGSELSQGEAVWNFHFAVTTEVTAIPESVSVSSLSQVNALPESVPGSSLSQVTAIPESVSVSSLSQVTAVPESVPVSSLSQVTAVPESVPVSSLSQVNAVNAIPESVPVSSLSQVTAVTAIPESVSVSSLSQVTAIPESVSVSSLSQVTAIPESVPVSSLSQVTPLPEAVPWSWGVKIRKKLKAVSPFLGKFRPLVGQCCHQCTPESLGWKLLHHPSLGFQNVLHVKETHTRYRGWLVRRMCCILFVGSCKVYSSPAEDRLIRVYSTDRVKQALTAAHGPGQDSATAGPVTTGPSRRILRLVHTGISPTLLRLAGWFLLKLLNVVFCSVQVNLNQLAALHRATQLKSPLVFVSVRQSCLDQALISLVLFCHSLRVPYTVYTGQVHRTWFRVLLKKLGVLLFPDDVITEGDAEMDHLYSSLMTSLVGELLCSGESLSIGIDEHSGHGSQWLARVRQALTDGLVPDVSVVPVGISYDCPPYQSTALQAGWLAALWFVVSLLRGDQRGSVRIHFAQAFSLKEMCESGKCRVDRGRPLQELLLPAVLHNRTDSIFGQKDVSWVLPPEWLRETPSSDRQLTVALTFHLLHSTTYCTAVMSTSLVSCLLLHKHRKGVRVSQLCRDMLWLLEEVLFRNRDVGFAGSLAGVVCHALHLLRPWLLMAAPPPKADPVVAPRPTPQALLTLRKICHPLTHVFSHEAVGACAVLALFSEVAGCRGDGAEMEFDVTLCQDELTNKCLQLTHLLQPGFIPPCQSALSFALDAVDSLVRCGILVMEEIPRDVPVCDLWRRHNMLSWKAADDSDHSSDSDCEEPDTRFYKLSQPSECPELLFFLCSLMSVQLRALCWTVEGVHLLPTPLPESDCVNQLHTYVKNRAELTKTQYESTSVELVKMAVRTLTDLGVLTEERKRESVYLDLSPVFHLAENRRKIHHFISQFTSQNKVLRSLREPEAELDAEERRGRIRECVRPRQSAAAAWPKVENCRKRKATE